MTTNKNICDVCGKEYEYALSVSIINGVKKCKHDSDVQPNKTELKRHANYESSLEALKMANLARQENPIEEISVISSQKGSSGKTERIPKKVVDSILEKVKNEEALQE